MTTLETATKNYREKGEIEMKITPDEAQKLIHSLEEDRRQLVDKMKKLVTFVVGVSEGDPEKLRPEFNFSETVHEIEKIDERIRRIRHARNIFNTTTFLPDEKITVDEALILMSMLNKNYSYYLDLGNRQPKEREDGLREEIEYSYINYDVREVKQYGKDMYERMLEIQTKLNLVNSTCTFEVD